MKEKRGGEPVGSALPMAAVELALLRPGASVPREWPPADGFLRPRVSPAFFSSFRIHAMGHSAEVRRRIRRSSSCTRDEPPKMDHLLVLVLTGGVGRAKREDQVARCDRFRVSEPDNPQGTRVSFVAENPSNRDGRRQTSPRGSGAIRAVSFTRGVRLEALPRSGSGREKGNGL